jgi:hypothetical protein
MLGEEGMARCPELPPGVEVLLRNLHACERGLSAAYAAAQASGRLSGRAAALATEALAAHEAHARLLARVLERAGIHLFLARDDLWVQGDPRAPATLAAAEVASHDTWHDALLDLPAELVQGLLEWLVAEHEALTASWQALLGTTADPTVTV